MPKAKTEKATKPLRHNPLADEIIEAADRVGLRRTPRNKARRNSKAADDEERADVLPAGITRKLLRVAQAQKADDEDDFDGLQDEVGSKIAGSTVGDDEEVHISDVEVDEEGFVVTEGATEEEERALALFLPRKSQQAGLTLADVILKKIQEHEARQDSGAAQAEGAESALSPKVIQVYGEIGKWLKTYKSGKLPKAFKVIPNLTNWEEVLSLTNPLNWTAAAMYEAVNIFASNLNPRMAQRFYNLVLLPALRQNIAEYKKLNFHYYRALKKALFKPAAFFKGIVLPLAQENCTLREAVILSSVLMKASVPAMHAAATLVRLCVMTPWYGTTAIIMASLLNKKYALPIRVVDCLVDHFCAFSREEQTLPLVWHRALLIFVQRYKLDLSEEHRQRLKELLRVHFHDAVGHEVRRELLSSAANEAETASTAGMDIG